MDNETKISELKEMVRDFCRDRGWDPYHNPKDLSIGMITEASELLEIFRFVTTEDCEVMMQSSATREAIADELSDVLYFILRFAQKYEFDLSSEFIRKMGKNNQKYPRTMSA